MTSNISIAQFRGCLLGLALGDALGAPFEGLPPEAIWYELGGALKAVHNLPTTTPIVYTDDTQMAIGVAEVLLAIGEIDEDALAHAFARNYDDWRGYGPGVRRMLDAAKRGENWRSMAVSTFPGGSLGNGAAMRVAPVGICFAHDRDRLETAAVRSATPTHTHPVGIDGARIMAIAVAAAARSCDLAFDRAGFYAELIDAAATEEFRSQLERAARMGPSDSAASLGNTLKAHESVVTAIECFACSEDSFLNAVVRAIGLGGDTDTIAAMAGALCGARHGLKCLPADLLARLEDGEKGRRYINDLAASLHQRFVVDVARH